jgi:NTP pyrophosphatase (non-canonical NTP hydrolase)
MTKKEPNLVKMLVHHGKHGDTYWLADTNTHRNDAYRALFNQLDAEGCYEGEDETCLELARKGYLGAVKGILGRRQCCEYEGWDIEWIEIPNSEPHRALVSEDLRNLDAYQIAAHALAVYPPEAGLSYSVLGLTGEAGEVAEKVAGVTPLDSNLSRVTLALVGKTGRIAEHAKKIIRDDDGEMTNDRKLSIIKELGGVLWYLAEVATVLGQNLSDIAAVNLSELYSRKERGVLHGDGDNR